MRPETQAERIARYAAIASEHHLDPAELSAGLDALEAELDAALARRPVYVKFLVGIATLIDRIADKVRGR